MPRLLFVPRQLVCCSRRTMRCASTAPTAASIGVAAVIFPRVHRGGKPTVDLSRVLLIQRGRPPGLGMWCFPGGRLELGETMSACAARETFEETGVDVHIPPREVAALGAHDVIDRDDSGGIRFHYCVAHVLGFADCKAVDGTLTLPATNHGDDAMAAAWVMTGLPPPAELLRSRSADGIISSPEDSLVHLVDLFAAKTVIPQVRNVLDIARAWLAAGL